MSREAEREIERFVYYLYVMLHPLQSGSGGEDLLCCDHLHIVCTAGLCHGTHTVEQVPEQALRGIQADALRAALSLADCAADT